MASKPVVSLPTVTEATFLASAATVSSLLPPVSVEVAFAGRSNVGKSSLINALVNRKSLTRTSNTPGCTRAINFFQIRCGHDVAFHLVDLPGYGYARRSKGERTAWGNLLDQYLTERITLRLVILLVDVRRGFEDEERDLVSFLHTATTTTRPPVQVVAVGTKIDKLPLSQRKIALRACVPPGIPMIGSSSVSKEGMDLLWKQIYRVLGVIQPINSR